MIGCETLLIALSLVILLLYYIRGKWKVLRKWCIPHDAPSIFRFGHFSSVFGNTDVPEFYLKCKRKFGNVWGYYILTEPWIVVHDKDLLKQILTKDSLHSFPNRANRESAPLEDILFSGLVFATEEQWKRLRVTLSPAFTSSKLRDMSPIIIRCVETTIESFTDELKAGNNNFKVNDVFGRFSLDVICATVFGIDVNSPSTGIDVELLSRTAAMLDNNPITRLPLLLTRSFPSLRRFTCSTLLRRRRQCTNCLKAFCETIMKQREKSLTQKPRDLMQSMVDSRIDGPRANTTVRKGMTEYEIAANSITMLLAGRGAVTNAMIYLAYNLATHPSIQRKLQNEIDIYFSEYGSLDWNVVSKIKYLEMCILESLRLYCPFVRMSRRAKRDVTVGNFTILKHTSIDIPIQALSRDPQFWSNPLEYDPERFRDQSTIDYMVYQPFGNGPRVCIGKRFAVMEIKLFLSKLLHKFALLPSASTPSPPLPVIFQVTAMPQSPIRLKIALRTE